MPTRYKRANLKLLFLAFGLILLVLIWSAVALALRTSIADDETTTWLLVICGFLGSGLTVCGTGLLIWQIRRQDLIEQNLRTHEAELVAARENLERSNDELKNFARVIAHDLQEPLRAIISYAQLLNLRYHGKMDEDADEFIGYLVSGAASMKARLMDLLDYATIDRASHPPQPVDLDAIMAEVQTYYADDIRRAQAKLEIGPLPTVMATHKRMSLVFEHLLSNALEYREPSRPLKISVSAKELGNGFWEIVFADNGIGIEPQYFERIFLIFQRLHTVAEHGGTGVGLAICKKVVEQLGGLMRVESQYGRGTSFRFTLPAARTDEIQKA